MVRSAVTISLVPEMPGGPFVFHDDLAAARLALPGDFAEIIRHIEDRRIDTKPWITHHGTFDDMIGAFSRWLDPASGVIKTMVEVSS